MHIYGSFHRHPFVKGHHPLARAYVCERFFCRAYLFKRQLPLLNESATVGHPRTCIHMHVRSLMYLMHLYLYMFTLTE